MCVCKCIAKHILHLYKEKKTEVWDRNMPPFDAIYFARVSPQINVLGKCRRKMYGYREKGKIERRKESIWGMEGRFQLSWNNGIRYKSRILSIPVNGRGGGGAVAV